MRKDLDRLMEKRGLDALVVSGSTYGNPSLVYLLKGADVSQGIVVKKRGEEAVFIHATIERDEARATGLPLIDIARYGFVEILKEKGNRLAATVELYRRIFADLEVRGRVGFYGADDPGRAYVFLRALDDALSDIEVVGEYERSVLTVARETKDADEIAQIQEIAQQTCEVMAATVEYLRRHRVRDGVLVTDDGAPLTVGSVKQHILRLLAGRRLEDPEGMIFAIGHDAGVPHSKGRPDDPIRLGQTIVYDLFPRRPRGYFFDVTRTFCLGYAPPEVERAYRDVADCLDAVVAEAGVGVEARRLQQVACAFLEERGHPSIAGDPQVKEGFVHLIGHGLGLSIHESPSFYDVPTNGQTLQPGHVFTVEPGVYYPDRGYGVRLEDVIWIDEEGEVHNLTDLPKRLVVEMGG
ncbi:MAG TPA: aminopeptidase P family protein [Anaerolineae bacterium]|nr:aminopeptidase P family protein [Anaerolineae bacterium]